MIGIPAMKFSRLVAIAAEAVAATQRKFPADIREAARAVPVHYEAAPHPTVLEEGFEPDILGLFTGNPHGTELAHDNPAPPQILLYINSLWDYAEEDVEIFRDEVRLTYLHELGHYFGWDEGQVAARGLD
jgi:predicted Zn-dependent protease with MMP-like domain